MHAKQTNKSTNKPSPLFFSDCEKPEIIKTLLFFGADITLKDSEGKQTLGWLNQTHHIEIELDPRS
jgi:hypothetical protein